MNKPIYQYYSAEQKNLQNKGFSGGDSKMTPSSSAFAFIV